GMRPSMQCLFLGIMLAGAVFTVLYSRNREQQKKDNDALIRDYPFLVNRLWLLLGTGMTVQMGIRQIMSELNDNVCLKRELEYAIHCLQTGGEESLVYEQLGRRLKLPEYNRLFRQLGQHVRIGTKDLRNLMELEMQTALKKRRELAKKKGEEASTKLLFPMIVLLALVMVLIVYPAMTGL
ncbi:MAG: type II secretion system F family protein, partial [Clostridium sp.]|nr:type II secretion system F family protein [Clostridium sp.]